MITISKAEAKMIREKFPRAHRVTTVHKTMVDETRDVLKALVNNVDAQQALEEMERDERRRTARTLGDEVVA